MSDWELDFIAMCKKLNVVCFNRPYTLYKKCQIVCSKDVEIVSRSSLTV